MGGLMIKNIKKALIIGLCTTTVFTGSIPVYSKPLDKGFINSGVSDNSVVFEDLKTKPEIECTFELKENTNVINFDKIGSYSVYMKGVPNLIQKIDFENKNKTHEKGEQVEEYIFVTGNILTNQIIIENLEPATTYNYYCYNGQEPIIENLIREISFKTAPERLLINEKAKTDKSITLSWNSAKNAVQYEIYREGDLIQTLEADKTDFVDKGLDSSTEYTYEIKARYEDTDIDFLSESCEITVKTKEAQKSTSTGIPFSYTGVNSGSMGLPNVSGECKTWANYQAVTMKSSPQYKLLNASNCYTDPETGIRMVDDCYCVALGSYYGSKIGQKYLIKLSSGNEFKAILCDQKANRHTDANNQYALNNKDIIEFYIDRRYKPSCVGGSYNSLPQFKGAVVSIEKISG